ncbi:uncharacterized protein [Palaemon carinicauda]|uniref:uncharacterized protein n=1 Tax=Palaemon carinicauda TaxID=392227 RepID=UPI0035B68724
MKKAADDGEPEFGKRAAEFVRKDFYVDDGLTSVSTPSDAVELISVPKLELTAAELSVKVSSCLNKVFNYSGVKNFYYTDSRVVLGYIGNEAKRFHVFVANRVQQIKNLSSIHEWVFVSSAENPADIASRGASVQRLLKDVRWFSGPSSLWEPDFVPESWCINKNCVLSSDDPEVKKIVSALSTSVQTQNLDLQGEFMRFFILSSLEESCCIVSEIYDNGLLRLGGRLSYGYLSYEEKFPVVLPKISHITSLVIGYCHSKVAHQGKSFTPNEIRSQGYWIMNASSVVASFIFKCVVCRRSTGNLLDQKMSDLPDDRGRKTVKRCGVLFVCMYSRAVHLEVADSLSTDFFINALRRFISIRGPITTLRCDNATNYVGAKKEFEGGKVREFLLGEDCNFEFNFNVPKASHMAGSWERLIRTIRSILFGILSNHGSQLDEDGLRTFLCEAAAIANNRPLSVENLNDPTLPPLTPNHLLTMKAKVVVLPNIEFCDSAMDIRKRWRRIQYVAQVFWARFKSEYLSLLQKRKKWNTQRQNLSLGDIVLIKEDNSSRDCWPLARVVELFPFTDGLVRKVKLQVGTKNSNIISFLDIATVVG